MYKVSHNEYQLMQRTYMMQCLMPKWPSHCIQSGHWVWWT